MSCKNIITITRQYGSGGHDIGKALSERLGIPFYDKELISLAAKESGISPEVFENVDEKATNSLLYSLSLGLYNYGNGFHLWVIYLLMISSTFYSIRLLKVLPMKVRVYLLADAQTMFLRNTLTLRRYTFMLI